MRLPTTEYITNHRKHENEAKGTRQDTMSLLIAPCLHMLTTEYPTPRSSGPRSAHISWSKRFMNSLWGKAPSLLPRLKGLANRAVDGSYRSFMPRCGAHAKPMSKHLLAGPVCCPRVMRDFIRETSSQQRGGACLRESDALENNMPRWKADGHARAREHEAKSRETRRSTSDVSGSST